MRRISLAATSTTCSLATTCVSASTFIVYVMQRVGAVPYTCAMQRVGEGLVMCKLLDQPL